jgi:predicted nucleic acid-binding Zn ribbon protein
MQKNKMRKCPNCGDNLLGRIDKKFCSDQCRNTFNNRQKSDSTNMMRNINNILRKNRSILRGLNKQSGKTMVSREAMLTKGFNFNYLTHTYTTQKGFEYRFCYEQGYLFLQEKNLYLLVEQKEKEEKPN